MGIYDPLNIWLDAQPPHIDYITVSFAEMEKILGFELRPTPRRKSQWWENNSTQHTQARAWLDAGFVTEQVSISNGTLTFRRRK